MHSTVSHARRSAMSSRLTLPVDSSDHTLGSADAPATLVEYGDYECPHCARAHYVVGDVLQRVGRTMQYAFRHFPLSQIHEHAVIAALAAEAAGAQRRFWTMHATLFEHQSALALEDILGYADQLDLDVRRMSADVREGRYL